MRIDIEMFEELFGVVETQLSMKSTKFRCIWVKTGVFRINFYLLGRDDDIVIVSKTVATIKQLDVLHKGRKRSTCVKPWPENDPKQGFRRLSQANCRG